MAWTYSGDPGSSDRDAVRFEIPDTDPGTALMQDAEIDWALAQEGGVLLAAARCCEALARKFATRPDTSFTSGEDTVRRTYSAMAKEFAARATELRTRAQSASAPWFGGSSHARKQGLAEEPDRVQPTFRRDQFDSPFGRAT